MNIKSWRYWSYSLHNVILQVAGSSTTVQNKTHLTGVCKCNIWSNLLSFFFGFSFSPLIQFETFKHAALAFWDAELVLQRESCTLFCIFRLMLSSIECSQCRWHELKGVCSGSIFQTSSRKISFLWCSFQSPLSRERRSCRQHFALTCILLAFFHFLPLWNMIANHILTINKWVGGTSKGFRNLPLLHHFANLCTLNE